MKLSNPKLVKFHCCGDEHEFLFDREFYMCRCQTCGYDAGDGYYARFLGPFDKIEIVKRLPLKVTKYVKENNLCTSEENDVTIISDSTKNWKIHMINPSRFKLESRGINYGYFSALKDAYKKAKKLCF